MPGVPSAPPVRKANLDTQVHKAQHSLVLLAPRAAPARQALQASSARRVAEAATRLARLVQPDLPVSPAGKAQLVRPVYKALRA